MPKVPTYDSFQVEQTNLPNVMLRPPGARFDAPFSEGQATLPGRALQQAGQAMTNAGAGVAKIVIDEFEQANQVRVNDALNQAAKARLELTFNPQTGFTNLKGENALKRPGDKPLDQEFSEKLHTQLDGIEKNLGNDAQRLRFKQQAGQLMVQFQASLNQHIAKEYGQYQDTVDDGTIKTGQEQMALAWGDTAAIKQATDAIRAAVYNKGNRLGLAGKAGEALMVEQLSPGHAAVITAAVDSGNVGYAKEYLKQANAELTPQARIQLTRAVDTGAFEERTQGAAGDLWTKHKGNISAALSEAREKFTGKDEDAIVTRLKTLDGEQVAIRERRQATARDEAWKIYASTGSLAKVPPTVLAGMDGKDLVTLRNTARAEAEGREVKTDPTVYYSLTIAAATDPNFAREDLRNYFDKLSPADRKHFADLQGKAMKGEEGARIATVTQQKDTMAKTLGLKDKDLGLFHQEADRSLLAETQRLGRMPNQEETQKVLDRLVLEGTTPGSWFGKTRAFKAQAQGQAFTPSWNDDQRRKATAALQRQGIKNPTASQVEDTLKLIYTSQ